MFIAHLPAGYLLTQGLQRYLKTTRWLWVGLVASVLPDIDLLYFYLIDHRQTVHHEYFTHLPVFWLSLWAISLLVVVILRNRQALFITTIFFANVILHLVLDTFVGGIAWLYPFNNHSFALFTVQSMHDFWVWNFVLSWSFLGEILIVVAALGYLIYEAWSARNGSYRRDKI